ncbi:hypothetical protein [Streptomyces sp. NPDC003480]
MQAPEPSESGSFTAFERVLEEALDSQQVTEALGRSGGVLGRGQLRAQALRARGPIEASAALEFRELLEARAAAAANAEKTDAGEALSGALRDRSGLLSLMGVLVPTLAAVSALVFLVSGYGFRVLDGRPYIGDGLITAGLIAAAVAVGGMIGDLVYLLVAAARNTPVDQEPASQAPDQPDVPRVHEEWELALLERGVIPFLLGRLEEACPVKRGNRQAR